VSARGLANPGALERLGRDVVPGVHDL